jgi:ATP-dependent Lon protease
MRTFQTLPVLPIRNAVAFPGITQPFLVRRPAGLAAIRAAQEKDGLLIAVAQRTPDEREPGADDLHEVGTVLHIEKVKGSDKQGLQIWVRGVERVALEKLTRERSHWSAEAVPLADRPHGDSDTISVLFRSLKELAHQVVSLLPGQTEELLHVIDKIEEPALLAWLCAHYLEQPIERKQPLLEKTSLKERYLLILEWMRERRESLSLEGEIRDKLAQKLNRSQREMVLREQMRTIREELGEEGESAGDDLRKKLEDAGMPEEVRKVADPELKRLESLGSNSPETHVIRNYLETLAAMPWAKSSGESLEKLDIDEAQAILDEDHYGLEKIKRTILQSLAVMKLRKEAQGTILLFVGPPGVGKTSLGQSIARSLGRKFVRVSLGGVRDDAEIRGHRRTYIGAMPGKIVQGLKRAGERNPVFMLDEIDKLANSFHGDPAAALLEVLDPEQNKAFTDHYLDVPFDLSEVFFIATANSLDTIPPPLLDRMEVIQLSGYTTAEKLRIARKYLIPRKLKEAGLQENALELGDPALSRIIQGHTREAGVRELSRRIGALAKFGAMRVLKALKTGPLPAPVAVDDSMLEEVFGPERYVQEAKELRPQAGVVTGLAWTPVGGDILFIESSLMPGSGRLTLTGQLGDVMKESAQIALSIVRASLPSVSPGFEYEKKDLHIHVPSGAIPKDGPSAGITMLTSIASLFTGRSVSPELAMTGEVTLRGAVLPVGGIKEKMIAAHRAGIRRVILSSRNRKDLREVPDEVRQDLEFVFVDTTVQVLEQALGIRPLSPCFGDPQTPGAATLPPAASVA